MNMMAVTRYVEENDLDTAVIDQFFELMQMATKLQKLKNDSMKVIVDCDPENRAKLNAIESKLSLLKTQIDQLSEKCAEIGVDFKKLTRNQDKTATQQAEFSKHVSDLRKDLPEGANIGQITPFLGTYLK